MKVHWTKNASENYRPFTITSLRTLADTPKGWWIRITRKSDLLRTFPQVGTEVPEYGDPSIRELLEYPYRIIYQMRENRIDVLSVVHGARQLPPGKQ